MKIVIMNLSGNTGKTTLARHLFAPKMNAKRISIEDVNAGDGEADVEISSLRFKQLAAELNYADDSANYVIDIGASNAKLMLNNFDQLSTTTDAIDFWVIPVIQTTKQRIDSLNTVTKLIEIGVDVEKIILLPNKISEVETFSEDFSNILAASELGVCVASEPVLANDAYEMLKDDPRNIFDVAGTKPDFVERRKALREAGDEAGLMALGKEMVLFDMCKFASKNLNRVFKVLPLNALV